MAVKSESRKYFLIDPDLNNKKFRLNLIFKDHIKF
jgi:hypothetical protein